MPRISVFNSPFLLGFDQFERTFERVSKAAQDGYPPYNIEQNGDQGLTITLAVAGFTEDDLEVTLQENQLVIRGKQTDDQDRTYLYRGIAARQFVRTFMLANGIEIAGATLENGLLNINLERPVPEQVVKRIEINAKSNKTDNVLDIRPATDSAAKG